MKITASEATGMNVVVSTPPQNGIQYVVRFAFCNSIYIYIYSYC